MYKEPILTCSGATRRHPAAVVVLRKGERGTVAEPPRAMWDCLRRQVPAGAAAL
jgi:hypothetical protein